MAKWQRWKGIQKAYPFEEKRLAKWPTPYIVQPKYDGIRCRAVPLMTGPKGNEYLLLSSEENIIYSVPHINGALQFLQLRAELDGELYCHGMSFEDILSITSRSINLHHNFKAIKFHVFDIINDQPQMRRQIIVDALRGVHGLLEIAPFWLCESLDDVKEIYDKVISLGYEGIIIRHNMAPYERKRSTLVMKFKPKRHDTYIITGWKEEVSMEGVPKGRIGSLIMASQAGDEFAVGAGLDSNEKAELWKTRDQLAGKEAIVHYQHLTNKKIPSGTFDVEVIE